MDGGFGTGGSFSNAASATSTFSGTAGVSYVLKWTISNAPCTASEDQVTIKFNQSPTVANAGVDQLNAATCGLTTVTLAGNTPTVGTGLWTIVSGTGGSFSNTASPTSTFSGTAGVSYVLKWTISNAPCTASEDQITIKFNQNTTVANAGVDQLNAATCGLTTVTLAGNVPTVGTGLWTVVSGTGGSFANSASATTTFSGTAGVSYVLKWTISGSPCTSSEDQVTIKFNASPTVANAGVDQLSAATCGLTTVTLAGNAPTVGTGLWTVVSGTGGSFANSASATSTFSGTTGVTYVLKWTISNAPCPPTSDQVTVEFGNNFTLAIGGDAASKLTPDNNVNYNLTGPECRIIATVKGASLSTGATPFTASVTVDALVANYNSQPYLQRHFVLSPGGTVPTSATVTLYVAQDEFTAFNSASTVKLPKDALDSDNTKDKLRIWQWHGAGLTSAPDFEINPDDENIQWDAAIGAWKITFNVTGFSAFFITADNASPPLPVKLLDFTAKKQEGIVLLDWKTTEEVNSDRFEIERSGDARAWIKIGDVLAKGESKSLEEYSFKDKYSSVSTVYYRLKMIDLDGTFAYSRIVSVNFGNALSIILYPNPASQKLTVTSDVPVKGYALRDVSGLMIHEQWKLPETRNLDVQLNHTPSGVYIIQLQLIDGRTEYRKVVVFK